MVPDNEVTVGPEVITGAVPAVVVKVPSELYVGPLALVYALTWILQTIGQGIFWAQPGPAIVGFFGSGIFVLLALWRSNQKPQR